MRGGQLDASSHHFTKAIQPAAFKTQPNTQPDVFTDYSFGKVFRKAVNLAAKVCGWSETQPADCSLWGCWIAPHIDVEKLGSGV